MSSLTGPLGAAESRHHRRSGRARRLGSEPGQGWRSQSPTRSHSQDQTASVVTPLSNHSLEDTPHIVPVDIRPQEVLINRRQRQLDSAAGISKIATESACFIPEVVIN